MKTKKETNTYQVAFNDGQSLFITILKKEDKFIEEIHAFIEAARGARNLWFFMNKRMVFDLAKVTFIREDSRPAEMERTE